jgi:AcrR family transcriptional regulator
VKLRAKTTRTPRGPRGEETRDRILAAALALFRRRGYAQTTMREIAAEAEVALGGAYHYFPSKEALVLAYYEETQRRSAESASRAFAESSDPRVRLGAVFHARLDVLAKDRKLMSGLFQSIADPAASTSIFSDATDGVREDSIRLFEEALAPSPEWAKLDADVRRILVLAFWSLQMGVLLYFVHDKSVGQTKTKALVDRTLDLVCELLPVAPAIAPVFGERVGSILADAGLLGRRGM